MHLESTPLMDLLVSFVRLEPTPPALELQLVFLAAVVMKPTL